MAYPDTDLKTDTPDPLYGGRPALEFGGLAWQWVANVLDFLQRAHLAYNRAPYRSIAPIVTGAVDPGDVVLVDLATGGAGSIPLVRKAAAGDETAGTSRVLGVCVSGAANGKRAVVATGGLVPRALTGFAALTAGQAVAVDYSTGRLKVAGGGDAVVAYGDVRGNVLLAGGVG